MGDPIQSLPWVAARPLEDSLNAVDHIYLLPAGINKADEVHGSLIHVNAVSSLAQLEPRKKSPKAD